MNRHANGGNESEKEPETKSFGEFGSETEHHHHLQSLEMKYSVCF